MQNCPAPRVSEATYAVGERVDVAVGEGAGEDEDRVDRGHLGVDRDRLRPRGGGRDERQPAAAGAGEADGLDPRVARPGPGRARRRRPARGRTRRRAGRASRRPGDGAADQLGGAGVGLWPLTTTGQPAARAEAVSPPAVEKASGKLLAPKTATGPSGIWRCRRSGRGSGCAVGQGRVDADAEEVAVADDARRTGAAGRWCGRPRRRSGPRAGRLSETAASTRASCRPRCRRRRVSGRRPAARGWWRGRCRRPPRRRWSRPRPRGSRRRRRR